MRINITYHIDRDGKPLQEYDKPEQAVANFEQIAKNEDNGKKRVYCNIDRRNKYFPSGSITVENGCCFDRVYYTLVSVVEEPDPLYTSPYYTTPKKTVL